MITLRQWHDNIFFAVDEDQQPGLCLRKLRNGGKVVDTRRITRRQKATPVLEIHGKLGKVEGTRTGKTRHKGRWMCIETSSNDMRISMREGSGCVVGTARDLKKKDTVGNFGRTNMTAKKFLGFLQSEATE
ncbi:uncharacterized protein LOC135266778 isoform X2 [Tribolium castaneum]|uniref:uncharacterized protein LOC135266778 isoform X2 n=1 Tax=Tribolium castaneum TaxID=7070 RepID=UPI0030FDF9EB